MRDLQYECAIESLQLLSVNFIMGRASLESLPVELHTIVLKNLLSSSCRLVRRPFQVYEEVCPDAVEWIEKDSRSPCLFPYNVAMAWSLWHDILIQLPECWTRVVFDLAKDPAPFLDVFAWSKNTTRIEVVVYNSCGITGMSAAEEGRRVKAIAEALEPHIPRCRSIIFNSLFSSSLPPPNIYFVKEAPHLEKLTLECYTDNVDLSKVPRTTLQWRQYTSFPRLKQLSLTGFWFLYLVQHAHSGLLWLQELTFAGYASIQISCFAFPESGDYSMETFMNYLSLAQTGRELYLRELSLSFSMESVTKPFESSWEISSDLYFHSVSKSFLSLFVSLVKDDYYGRDVVSFEKCELPAGMHTSRLGRCSYLSFNGIISNGDNASLRDIIDSCSNVGLTISNCPSFNDDELRWLGTPQQEIIVGENANSRTYREFPASGLMSLMINDCPHISPRALIELVENRYDTSLADDLEDDYNLGEVDVRGKGLAVLTEEEEEAFKQLNKSLGVQMSWKVEKESGEGS